MNLRPQRRETPELNLIPLIDVLIVLLIFLVMTTTFQQPSALGVKLPEADSAQAVTRPETSVVVEISSAGQYRIAGRDPVAQGLSEVLADALPEAQRQHIPVFIHADASTPHQAVMEVLDVLSRLGVSQVQLMARPEGSSAVGQGH
ncbi:MAG: hypothetical protein RIQ52_1090 [Pseudomonadota bacterium]